jgi:hypothetical protein
LTANHIAQQQQSAEDPQAFTVEFFRLFSDASEFCQGPGERAGESNSEKAFTASNRTGSVARQRYLQALSDMLNLIRSEYLLPQLTRRTPRINGESAEGRLVKTASSRASRFPFASDELTRTFT